MWTSNDINVVGILVGPHSTYPRTWNRSASNLGSQVDAEAIAKKLQWLWPPSEYPVHIQILGGLEDQGISVRVWNSTGIKESEVAYAADYAGSEDPTASAAFEEIECILKRLGREGKL